MRSAFFHEDDYCQIEILPVTAKDFCIKEMSKINDFIDKRSEKNGIKKMYLRNKSPKTIKDLNLSSKKLAEDLNFLKPYDKVETGYSSYREECKNVYARGEKEDINVFWSVDEKEIVKAIWLDMWITPENNKLWNKILCALGKLGSVMLADWEEHICLDITSQENINKYVERKENR